MPDPDVSVSQGEPQVQSSHPIKVIIHDSGDPEIQVATSEKPVIRYERQEPRIQVHEVEGEPTVRFESAASVAAAGAASVETIASLEPTSDPQITARPVQVSSLAGLEVVNTAGETVGTVDRLLASGDNKEFHLVIAHGGFLGLGEPEALLPLEDVSIWEKSWSCAISRTIRSGSCRDGRMISRIAKSTETRSLR